MKWKLENHKHFDEKWSLKVLTHKNIERNKIYDIDRKVKEDQNKIKEFKQQLGEREKSD